MQEHVEQTLPWLLETLSSESSSVERSGAALGLAEVIAVLGDAHLAAIIPGIIAGCSDRAPAVRDGNLTLMVRPTPTRTHPSAVLQPHAYCSHAVSPVDLATQTGLGARGRSRARKMSGG